MPSTCGSGNMRVGEETLSPPPGPSRTISQGSRHFGSMDCCVGVQGRIPSLQVAAPGQVACLPGEGGAAPCLWASRRLAVCEDYFGAWDRGPCLREQPDRHKEAWSQGPRQTARECGGKPGPPDVDMPRCPAAPPYRGAASQPGTPPPILSISPPLAERGRGASESPPFLEHFQNRGKCNFA